MPTNTGCVGRLRTTPDGMARSSSPPSDTVYSPYYLGCRGGPHAAATRLLTNGLRSVEAHRCETAQAASGAGSPSHANTHPWSRAEELPPKSRLRLFHLAGPR